MADPGHGGPAAAGAENTVAYKMSLKRLFDADRCTRIELAAKFVNKITTRAYYLLKLYYLTHVQPVFLADRQAFATRPFTRTEWTIKMALTIVQNSRHHFRGGTSDPEDVVIEGRLAALWLPYGAIGQQGDDRMSLSKAFQYQSVTIRTAVLNNVRQRFARHVGAYIGFALRPIIAQHANVALYDALPRAEKIEWSKEIHRAIDDVMFHRIGALRLTQRAFVREWVEAKRWSIVPCLRAGLDAGRKSVFFDLSDRRNRRPFVYLPYMVYMNVQMAAAGQLKLLTPFPMRRGFIPAHFGMCTNAMIDLLADRTDLVAFRATFLATHGIALRIESTADLGKSFAQLADLPASTPLQQETYMDALWEYFAPKLCGRQLKHLLLPRPGEARLVGKMKLAHFIVTDGYSVSILATDAAVRGSKVYGANAGDAPDDATDPLVPTITVANAHTYAAGLLAVDKRLVSADPGKGELMTLIAEPYGKVVRYSAKQRRNETGRLTRAKARRKVQCSPLVAPLSPEFPAAAVGGMPWTPRRVENQIIQGIRPRTCILDEYADAMMTLVRLEGPMLTAYAGRMFR